MELNPLFWVVLAFGAATWLTTLSLHLVPRSQERRGQIVIALIVFFCGGLVAAAICLLLTGGPRG